MNPKKNNSGRKYSNDPVLSNYKDHGFKGMLVKPFTINELREILDKVLK